jgi:hypothetical protein
MFNQLFTGDGKPSMYPHQPPPAADRVEAVPTRLEARNITSVGPGAYRRSSCGDAPTRLASPR